MLDWSAINASADRHAEPEYDARKPLCMHRAHTFKNGTIAHCGADVCNEEGKAPVGDVDW